ncbi:MAG: hypothetical protein AAB373_00440 [Patescibacteria group bacterium]|mgnify:CR=1 FL=1
MIDRGDENYRQVESPGAGEAPIQRDLTPLPVMSDTGVAVQRTMADSNPDVPPQPVKPPMPNLNLEQLAKKEIGLRQELAILDKKNGTGMLVYQKDQINRKLEIIKTQKNRLIAAGSSLPLPSKAENLTLAPSKTPLPAPLPAKPSFTESAVGMASSAVSSVANFASGVGSSISSGLSSIGNSISGGFKSWFGKK